jgi:hypothetical protein
MTEIFLQRCFNHEQREAVARCPECGRFFCRECVTEHEERAICAMCLKSLTGERPVRRPHLRVVATVGSVVLGFFILWLMFYGLGYALLLMPTAFHQGTMWRESPFKSFTNESN